jgi:hypothetical protein
VVGFRFPKGLEQRAPQPVHLDEWLDALTYVPVRTRSRVGGQWSQTDETWLPRTPHTVALAKLTIPHGFKRLSSNGTDSFSIQFSQAVAIRSSCGQS